MTTAQIFQESLRTSIFGMGLVLTTLYVLSLILDIMRVVFTPRTTVKKNEAVTKDDTELIAVITTALSEYMRTPITNIKIGSIRQIHTKTPIWGMASRMHNINNKF